MVVIDVSNSPSFEDVPVMEFFQTSTRNLLNYEAAAGVGHHVALSVVGSDRLPESDYLRAKVAQEKLLKESSIPYSFDEFISRDLSAGKDTREVIADPHARYSGTELSEHSLVPINDALLGETRFEDWLSQSSPQPIAVAAASKVATGPQS